MSYNQPRKNMKNRWSVKYKKSINCNNPKGFSQKNYCKRKKRGGHYLETFSEWLSLNENVEENFYKWLETLLVYAKKPIEVQTLVSFIYHQASAHHVRVDIASKIVSEIGKDSLKDLFLNQKDLIEDTLKYTIKPRVVNIIKSVLKEKNAENYNWFAFSIGYLCAKPDYQKEDLEKAIEVTKRKIDSRELLKTEIGEKGWFVIGFQKAPEYIEQAIQDEREISNRQQKRMKKKGETFGEDENFIKLIINETTDDLNIKIYYLPALKFMGDLSDPVNSKLASDRHAILCKYGKDTQWCTAQPSWDAHKTYIKNNIYIIHHNDKATYQFVDCRDSNNTQFMDKDDRYVEELSSETFDILKENLKEQTACYKMSRRFSMSEFLLDKNNFYQASRKNLYSLLGDATTNKNQLKKFLKNFIEYLQSANQTWQDWNNDNDDDNGVTIYRKNLPSYEIIDTLIASLGVKEILEVFKEAKDVYKNIDERSLYLLISNSSEGQVEEILKTLISVADSDFILSSTGVFDDRRWEIGMNPVGPRKLFGLGLDSFDLITEKIGFEKVVKILESLGESKTQDLYKYVPTQFISRLISHDLRRRESLDDSSKTKILNKLLDSENIYLIGDTSSFDEKKSMDFNSIHQANLDIVKNFVKNIGLNSFLEKLGSKINNNIVSILWFLFLQLHNQQNKSLTDKLKDIPDVSGSGYWAYNLIAKVLELKPNHRFLNSFISQKLFPVGSSAVDVKKFYKKHPEWAQRSLKLMLLLGPSYFKHFPSNTVSMLTGLDNMVVTKPGNEDKVLRAIKDKIE